MSNRLLHRASQEEKERVTIEKRLYNASFSGSVESLNELMEEDKLTLTRLSITCYKETPLHLASMLGHLDFTKALLNYKPDLVIKLDSQGRSPLHLASANGYVEIVKLLLMVDSNVCLIRDEDDRTPLHLAVINGHVEVVNELIRARPDLTQYTLDRGETILHSCVIYNCLEALKLLLESSAVDDFVNVKDDNGYTILHTATALKQKKTVKYLLNRDEVRVNEKNRYGFTALDIIEQAPRDLKYMEIFELLIRVGVLRGENTIDELEINNNPAVPNEISPDRAQQLPVVPMRPTSPQNITMKRLKKKPRWFTKKRRIRTEKKVKKNHIWWEKKRDALMIAATVIAGMAYQAGLNPPSGVWQDNRDNVITPRNKTIKVYAGTSVMAAYYPDEYNYFSISNTICFVASLSIVLLLVSGLPLKRRIFMWFLMAAMWVTMTVVTQTYTLSMQTISPQYDGFEDTRNHFIKMATVALLLWDGLIFIIFLWHTCRFIVWIIMKVFNCIFRKRMVSLNVDESEDQGPENV